MGQAQFYNADFLQASATFFLYSSSFAKDEEVVAEARLASPLLFRDGLVL